MNKLFAIFISLITICGITATAAAPAYAGTDNLHSVILKKDQTINKDYFSAGDTVTILGTVNGDAYVAGGTVIVDGTINGDLLVAGGTITIRGKVRDDIRAAGGQILVSGQVGRNITTLGGSVTIAETASISGSLAAGTGSLTIFAPIRKEANIAAGQVTIDTTITGDVQAGVGNILLTPNAKILGNFTYWSEKKAQMESNAQIVGTTTHNLPPQTNEAVKKNEKTPRVFTSFNPSLSMLSFLAALVVGLLITRFMPVFTQKTATVLLEKPLPSLGIGFLSMIIAPFIFILLLITVIGIPLDVILLLTFLVLIYLAKIVVGIAVGQKILILFTKKVALGWTLLVGLAIYYIVTLIPIIGFVIWMIAGLMGLGALLIEQKNTYRELTQKKLI